MGAGAVLREGVSHRLCIPLHQFSQKLDWIIDQNCQVYYFLQKFFIQDHDKVSVQMKIIDIDVTLHYQVHDKFINTGMPIFGEETSKIDAQPSSLMHGRRNGKPQFRSSQFCWFILNSVT